MASRKEAKSKAQMRKDKMKCNKPQRAPKGAKQKYIVKACDDGIATRRMGVPVEASSFLSNFAKKLQTKDLGEV